MAIYYYNERQLEKAIEFLKRQQKFLKTMGLDSDNYKNILSNIEFIKEELEKNLILVLLKRVKLIIMKLEKIPKRRFKNIKGLELSKRYFYDLVLPEFEKI